MVTNVIIFLCRKLMIRECTWGFWSDGEHWESTALTLELELELWVKLSEDRCRGEAVLELQKCWICPEGSVGLVMWWMWENWGVLPDGCGLTGEPKCRHRHTDTGMRFDYFNCKGQKSDARRKTKEWVAEQSRCRAESGKLLAGVWRMVAEQMRQRDRRQDPEQREL